MNAEKANHQVEIMCRVLGVSTSGYYAWAKRQPSLRQLEDESLAGIILDIWENSRKTCGAPRIHFELAAD